MPQRRRVYAAHVLTGGMTDALDAISAIGMPDKSLALVGGMNFFSVYLYDAFSSAVVSPPAVIAPTVGSGRWLRISTDTVSEDYGVW